MERKQFKTVATGVMGMTTLSGLKTFTSGLVKQEQ
jgi:hypothetical protein